MNYAQATAVRPPDQVSASSSAGAVRFPQLFVVVAIASAVWFSHAPIGVNPRAWHLLAIFLGTIAAIVLRPLPTGAVGLISLAALLATNTLTLPEAFSGFSNPVVWLVIAAFFLASGFIHTGLGLRIAYHFLGLLGRTTLGLAYALIGTDLMLSLVVPSNAARAGGVVYPILRSLGTAMNSEASSGTQRKLSSFLTITAYQGTCITSAMFLTSMAANPLAAELAAKQGVQITWIGWATAAIVPGLISLLAVPLLLFRIYRPTVTKTPDAAHLAREKLNEMGPLSAAEGILLVVFALLLATWALGTKLGVNATVAALGGVALLLATGAIRWDDILKDRSAWDTLVWFAVLVTMATQLSELGFIKWFSGAVSHPLGNTPWLFAFLVISLVYFYSHYFFASNTAHVMAMYAPFLAVAIAAGAPPLVAALVLGFFSSLFASTTHYGTAPGPIFFGSGNVELGTWWKLGGIVSAANILIWLGVGGLWWKILGLW